MTNATPAAGTPAADPYLRRETGRRLVRAARPAHARTRAPRVSGEGNGRDLAAVALLPKLDPRARAVDLPDTRAARRQRAGRPQRPGRVAQPRRPRPSGPSPPRQGEGQRHAPDVGGDHGPDRRRRRRPTATPDSTGAPSPRRRARSTSGWRAPTPRCPSTSTIRRVWAYQLDQRRVLARPLGLDDQRRTTCRGGCSPTPASSTPAICAAGGSARRAGCRSPASSSAAVGQGRAAGRRVRRAGASDRATGGS